MKEIESQILSLMNKKFVSDRGEESTINAIYLGDGTILPTVILAKNGGSTKTNETVVDFVKFYKLKQ